MKLPLKLEYACRVLIQLKPTFVSGEVQRVEDLAEREKISANYLVQILNDLRTAGLVESKRGKHGGYHLVKNPEGITLADIVRASEGALLQLNGAPEGESGEATAAIWREVFVQLEEKLKTYQLAEMGDEEDPGMWHI